MQIVYFYNLLFFNVKCTVANNLLDRSGLIILENGTKICFVKKTSLSLETKHVAHKLNNLFKFLWKNGMYWIIFLWWSCVYSRYTRNKIYLKHRVLLLVDIIWIGVISHNTTNFQGRWNFSFTSVADPGEGPGLPSPPLLFLDQTEARKVEKIFLETGPSPLSKDLDDRSPPSLYLKVWIRHCTCLPSKPSRPKQPRRRFRMNKSKIKYSGVDGFTFDQSTGWFLQLVHFSFRFVLLTC